MAFWSAVVSSVAPSPLAPEERADTKDEAARVLYWGFERV